MRSCEVWLILNTRGFQNNSTQSQPEICRQIFCDAVIWQNPIPEYPLQLVLNIRHFAVDETNDVVYLCDPSPFRSFFECLTLQTLNKY